MGKLLQNYPLRCFLHLPLQQLVLSTQSQNTRTDRLALAISTFQVKKKRYCYTIQLSMCDSELAEFEKENKASYLIISFNYH